MSDNLIHGITAMDLGRDDALKVLVDSSSKTNVSMQDQEASKRAREHGWVKPVEYAYDVYNASNTEDRDAAAKAKMTRDKAEQENQNGTTETGEDGEILFTADVPLWASNAVRYEWKDEYGDVGPEHPELERQLFGDQYTVRKGANGVIDSLPVVIESETKISNISSFKDAGLHPIMLKNVELCRYETPTPIQAYCLPAILNDHDVIAVAQTGSGKTAAFLIPILSKLMGKAKKLAAARPNVAEGFDPRFDGVEAQPLVLVIAPTRELSVQIFDEARRLCYRSMLRPCVAYGGGPAREQADELRKGCDVLIGTPGRLIDFLSRQGLLSLRRVRYTVIDEADDLVGPDWSDEMNRLLSGADKSEDADTRYMLFSATFPKEARALAREFLDDNHIRVRVGRAGSTLTNIKQKIIWVEEDKKRQAVFDLLMSTPPARTIVFVNNKKAADFLDDYLYNKGLPSTSIHSDRNQREREDSLRAFKNGKSPILVATGVSARGLDIKNVMHVINYDLPSTTHSGIQEYVHRIGRTGRIGNDGIASSFFNDRNEDIGPALVQILLESKQEIPDFLSQHIPEEGQALDFDDDSDDADAAESVVEESQATGFVPVDSFAIHEAVPADEEKDTQKNEAAYVEPTQPVINDDDW